MNRHSSGFLYAFSLAGIFLCGAGAAYADRVTVDGTEYRSARLTEVCREGVIYKTKEDGFVTLPWAELTESQKKSLKSKLKDSLLNSMYRGYYVKGTVFHVSDDGVVIQVETLDEEPEPYCRDGAEILTGGLVIIKDLPADFPTKEDAEVELVAYKFQTYTFDEGEAAKEIPYLTASVPLWGQEQEWKNADGQVMVAKFIAMKKRICFFEKGGKQFEYPLEKLDEEGQNRAADYQKKVEGFPFP